MEEEVKCILTQAVASQSITAIFREHFGSKKGVVLNLLQKPHEPMDFKE